ncbi:Fe-S oxidoreductase [Spirochaetia bacterium]|nr:Fe-S oxidoreductase [Spirochaetia bacterium]
MSDEPSVVRRTLKNTDKSVSLFGFGGFRYPLTQPGNEASIDKVKLDEMVDYAIAHGVNYFDTGYMYHDGASETCLGEILSKYPRDKYNFVTKMPIGDLKTEADVDRIFQHQLKKCRVDYFDFYLIHCVNKAFMVNCDNFHVHTYLKEKQRQGLIRHYGFSFHDTPELLKEAIDKYEPEFVQIQLNYMDWELQDAKTQYKIIKDRGLQLVVMEPVRGGMLAQLCEKSREIFKKANPEAGIASWALRYAASFPEVLCVLSGMGSLDQVKDNVRTFSPFRPLDDSERAVIDEAYGVYKKMLVIPCTACRYCCKGCPREIDIPAVFGVYNNYYIQGKFKKSAIQDLYFRYGFIPENRHWHRCIKCGACVRKCPQNIDIPRRLRTFGKVYKRAWILKKLYELSGKLGLTKHG